MCCSSVTAKCNKEKAGSCSRTRIPNKESVLIKTHMPDSLKNSLATNILLKVACVYDWERHAEEQSSSSRPPRDQLCLGEAACAGRKSCKPNCSTCPDHGEWSSWCKGVLHTCSSGAAFLMRCSPHSQTRSRRTTDNTRSWALIVFMNRLFSSYVYVWRRSGAALGQRTESMSFYRDRHQGPIPHITNKIVFFYC